MNTQTLGFIKNSGQGIINSSLLDNFLLTTLPATTTYTTEQLIASTATFAVGDKVTTIGYTSEKDGGEATWFKTSTGGQTVSQTPATRANIQLTDGNGDLWELIVDDYTNAKACGAKFDYVYSTDTGTDDTTALWAYCNGVIGPPLSTANTNKYRTIKFPAGNTYVTSVVLKSNWKYANGTYSDVSFLGEGKYSTSFYVDQPSTFFSVFPIVTDIFQNANYVDTPLAITAGVTTFSMHEIPYEWRIVPFPAAGLTRTLLDSSTDLTETIIIDSYDLINKTATVKTPIVNNYTALPLIEGNCPTQIYIGFNGKFQYLKRLSAQGNKGDKFIDLYDVSEFSVGGYYWLADYSKPIWREDTLTYVGHMGQYVQIRSIVGLRITFYEELEFDFVVTLTEGNVSSALVSYNNVNNIIMKDIGFHETPSAGKGTAIDFNMVTNFTLDDCYTENVRGSQYKITGCYNFTSHGIVSTDCQGDSYTYDVRGLTENNNINKSRCRNTRHLISTFCTNFESSGIQVNNCVCYEQRAAAFDSHPGGGMCQTFNNCYAFSQPRVDGASLPGYQLRGAYEYVFDPLVVGYYAGVSIASTNDCTVIGGTFIDTRIAMVVSACL